MPLTWRREGEPTKRRKELPTPLLVRHADNWMPLSRGEAQRTSEVRRMERVQKAHLTVQSKVKEVRDKNHRPKGNQKY